MPWIDEVNKFYKTTTDWFSYQSGSGIYYNNSTLGDFIITYRSNSVKQIKDNPFRFQIRYDEIRVVLLKTFPYLIHFSIDNETIVIKAVIHTSRNSKINKIF